MMDPRATSAMAREIAEASVAAERLLSASGLFSRAAERILDFMPRIAVVCGRGSSGHVGVYFRYLIEAQLGLLVSATAPSVMTAYGRKPDMSKALFIVVSQSGRSPDLVAPTKIARSLGALTLAIVNDEQSPVATESEIVLPIHAGPEQAIAATKTVVLSMLAGARLIATLTRDATLSEALQRLPARLQQALACGWSSWSESLLAAPAAFVTGRGYGLGSARELALKITETLRIPALGYSAAELRHGPRAAISRATPVLALRQNDEAAAAIDGLVDDLRESQARVFVAGGTGGTLPWIGDDHPICDPVAMLLPAYRAIETAARRKGLDPDRPPFLRKVTETL